MKRQSVEDYVKERFEMNSPVDEYVLVTNKEIARKNAIDLNKYYKVVKKYEDGGISIYNPRTGYLVRLSRDDFALSYTFVKPVDKEEKTKNEPDLVNHPSHYETGKFECIEVMEEALGRDVVKGFCIGNAFKYLYRAKRKNGLEDLKKAQWYLNRVISMEDEDNTTDPYVEQKARLKDLEDEILNETDKSERFV